MPVQQVTSDQPGTRPKMRCHQLVAFGEPLAEKTELAPQPTGTEVLVRVRGAGVCHTDVHLCSGSYDMGGGKVASLAGRFALPFTPGHENAGEVVATGAEAEGQVTIGRNYLVCPWIGCGQCAMCHAGDEHLCSKPQFLGVGQPGGYADYMIVPHPRYLIDIDGMDPVEAAPYACSGVTTYSALMKLQPGLADRPVVVIGAGGLGLMSLTMLRLLGGFGAVVVELDPAKRDAALAAGALAAIDPRDPDATSKVREASGGVVTNAVDFVGSGETVAFGFDLLGKGGKLVVVGLYGGAMQLSVMLLPSKSATLQGSYVGNVADMRAMMELVKRDSPKSIPITRRPLEDANAALAELQAGRVVGRTVLVP